MNQINQLIFLKGCLAINHRLGDLFSQEARTLAAETEQDGFTTMIASIEENVRLR